MIATIVLSNSEAYLAAACIAFVSVCGTILAIGWRIAGESLDPNSPGDVEGGGEQP